MYKDVTISETEYDLSNGKKGKSAIFIYPGPRNPKEVLDLAIKEYTKSVDYYEFIVSSLDNPWVRLVLSANINDIKQENFDEKKHTLKQKKNKD